MIAADRTIYVVAYLALAFEVGVLLAGCGGSPASGPPVTAPQVPTISAQVVQFDSNPNATSASISATTHNISLSLSSPTVEAEVVVNLITPSATAPNITESDDCSAILKPYIQLGSGMSRDATESQITKTYLPRAPGSCTLRFAGAEVEVSVPVSVTP